MRYSVEDAYLMIADGCDAMVEREREVFLAKLVLLLAERTADLDVLRASIETAKLNLTPAVAAEGSPEAA